MLIALQRLNNITADRLLTARHGVLSDNYSYQTTNNFEKLLTLKSTKNTSMIIIPILLVFCMHIGPTRLLEDGAPNAEFDAKKKLRLGFIGLDQDEKGEIERAITTDEDNKNEEDPQKKKKQLKRKKQRQKQVAKAKTRQRAHQDDANDADDNKDDNDQDTGLSALSALPLGLSTPGAFLLGLPASGASFLSFSTPGAPPLCPLAPGAIFWSLCPLCHPLSLSNHSLFPLFCSSPCFRLSPFSFLCSTRSDRISY